MQRAALCILLLCAIFLVSCSPGKQASPWSPPLPAEDQQKTGSGVPAQGQINGKDWVFRSGRAYFKKYPSNYLVVQLWQEDIADPCREGRGSSLQLRATAPKALQSWRVTPEDPFSNLSIFFTDLDFVLQPRDNMRADHGEVRFLDINKELVKGYIAGAYQNPLVGLTNIIGDFEVPLCEEDPATSDNF